MPAPANSAFKLGLVMAGAVSAGAYTAGVLDFLFEALNNWQAEKKSGRPDVPDHDVVIEVMSGASAGGVCAAFAGMLPHIGYFPVRGPDDPNIAHNLLYQAWVEQIDLETMLDDGDLKGCVTALLSGKPLDATAAYAVNQVAGGTGVDYPAWLANPLNLYLCLTNAEGIPYLLSMNAGDGTQRGHTMSVHGDYGHFAIHHDSPVDAHNADQIAWNDPSPTKWQRLAQAALASAAFPIGLPPRDFTQSRQAYMSRDWMNYTGLAGDDLAKILTIHPDWDNAANNGQYAFHALDGGAINNEPFDLARMKLLEGTGDSQNPRDANTASRAVLMIDPFPDDIGRHQPDYGQAFDVLDVLGSLLGAMTAQGRFKPEDLALAYSDSVFSRFLIAPLRRKATAGESDLASSGLGGFAGFVHRDLRRHDFFLGRRNCQRFLENYLVVGRDNPVVKTWFDRMTPAQRDDQHPLKKDPQTEQFSVDKDFVRLIPLYGSARIAQQAVPYPKLDYQRDIESRLKPGLNRRAKALMKEGTAYAAREYKIGWVGKIIMKAANWVAPGKMADMALAKIKADLEVRKII